MRKKLSCLALALFLSSTLLLAETTTRKPSSAKKPAAAKSVKGTKTSKTAKSAASKRQAAKKASIRKKTNPAALRRMNRAFVASAELKPMARQLFETHSPAAYAGVESYARRHATTDSGALAYLALGYAHIQDKDYPKAEAALDKAKPHAGELYDYVRYFQALAYGAEGKSDKVTAVLKDFQTQAPESIFQKDAVDIYGTALLAQGRVADAIQFLEANRTPVRAAVELSLAKAYLRTDQPEKGMQLLRRIYFTMPTSYEASQAGAELLTRGSQLEGTYQEQKLRADLLAKGGRWADAAREYRSLVDKAPAEERGNIQVMLGAALRRSGNGSDGVNLLQSAQAAGEANAQRLYNLMEIARNANSESDVLRYIGDLRQQAPTSPWLDQALLSAGNMYLLQKNYDRAIDMFREAQQRFQNGPRASYVNWKAAWLTYRQGRTENAKKDFEHQVDWYPSSPEVPAALYWRARIAEDEHDNALARAWYTKLTERFRNYYYGYLGRERLEKLPPAPRNETPLQDPVLAKIPPVQPLGPEASVVDAPETVLRVEKSRLLANAGLVDFAVKELQAEQGGKGPNWSTLQIAELYQQDGQYHRALQFLKRSVPTYYSLDIPSLPRPYWELLFPRPYWTDLRRFSMEQQLDPYLVASLIRQESEFNPGAVSHANAWGLMQLLPTVGKGEAKAVRMRSFNTSSLLVPAVNLQLGTRYFKEMLTQYNGQVEYALAAYNAGSNRVDDWLAQGHFRDVPEFVESIPFTETREYVQAIVRNAKVYSRLYPQ